MEATISAPRRSRPAETKDKEGRTISEKQLERMGIDPRTIAAEMRSSLVSKELVMLMHGTESDRRKGVTLRWMLFLIERNHVAVEIAEPMPLRGMARK